MQGQSQQTAGQTIAAAPASGAAPGAAAQPWGAPFPSLHLWPLQDTFQMKMIHLPEGQRIKIGRQTNNKTVPGERNAYFDSKVLSRTHAEIWEQGGKIYIKDVKSSNGTFINGDRLSPEGAESEPFELKSEDVVEFGIDIVSEDNRTIVHHKVAARAYCVFNTDDAALSARELASYQSDSRNVRRSNGAQPAPVVNPLSQMGPSIMSSGGKTNGLSFDHVLQKLQDELLRSKATGMELQDLAHAMTDIQDTLGGGLPPSQNGSAADFIPPQFRNPSAEAQAALAGPHGPQAAAFISLQSQMTDTQTSLAGHLEKIRLLEGQITQQETLKNELSVLRDNMEQNKREMEVLLAASGEHTNGHIEEEEEDDDDDARSVSTVTALEDTRRPKKKARMSDSQPKTSPKNSPKDSLKSLKDEGRDAAAAEHVELSNRVTKLSAEIAEALQLSRTLQAQHADALTTVKMLTDRVGALETGMADQISSAVIQAEQRWESWRVRIEDGWKKERDSWEAERERLRGVVREWEEASRRAAEEDEERAMNAHLSEDEFVDEEEDDDDDEDEDEDDGHAEHVAVTDLEQTEILTVGNKWKDSVGASVGITGEPADLIKTNGGLGDLSTGRGSLRMRRRRPSSRTLLARRGIKSIVDPTGSSTPKAVHPPLDPTEPGADADLLAPAAGAGTGSGAGRQRDLRTEAIGRSKLGRESSSGTRRRGGGGGGNASAGSSSRRTVKADSSESGRESADTLQGDRKQPTTSKNSKPKKPPQIAAPIPIVTVIVVAVIAGALYYRHKD